jgi:hypothetical protein
VPAAAAGAAADRARAAGQVEDPGRGAGHGLDEVDQGAEALLAVGQVALLLAVPRELPALAPLPFVDDGAEVCGSIHASLRASAHPT